ncbi:hypothetical protein EH183_42440 [Streptomyces sp. CB01881]|uniref:hypothetical protein n=1 Tax=Streptomyces sp. CB01881 TaxID=2078691 RepID=UPI0011DF15F6|nr:hypothetical protein [Streptomyces sp. CB01881]TYC66488.1 hypothetical protein EH183_42440 [Streptomyces sp. CB01881]
MAGSADAVGGPDLGLPITVPDGSARIRFDSWIGPVCWTVECPVDLVVRSMEQDGHDIRVWGGMYGMATNSSRLPVEFLVAVAAGADAGSAAARMAAEQARALADDRQYARLLEALLTKPFRDEAPDWLLEAAVTNGLRKAESEPDYMVGTAIELVALALAHPECGDALRDSALRRCTAGQLGSLGTLRRPPVLCKAVAAELRRRMPERPFITPALLKEPTPAQLVLRTERLHDDVFDTAVSLLPDAPDDNGHDDESSDAWWERFKHAFAAWETMWSVALKRHPDRHSQLVDRSEGTDAHRVITDQLLGSLPWMVEPGLLRRIALEDLDRFAQAKLVARVCRALQEGSSPEEARERFAAELASLGEEGRKDIEQYLEDGGRRARWGARAAVSWACHAAEGRWRLVLNPAEAKPSYGDPYTWLTPADDLADLGRHFADVAVQALQTWQPNGSLGISKASDLRWVHAMLLHLPDVTPAVKKTVQSMIRDARHGQARPRSYDYKAQEDHRQFTGLLAAISRIVADPLPQTPATRRAALGDPAQVTPRTLSPVTADVLDDYLDRHAGDDELVEKALLSFAHSGYGYNRSFPDVLARHTNPRQAVHTLTHELRSRLGGNPANREAWARHVLTLPDCPDETVLAMPAWTALKARGSHYDSIHPAVVALVVNTLGNDDHAWQRLADSPITPSGPNAWLRLGDILTAAAEGTAWPKPPAAR